MKSFATVLILLITIPSLAENLRTINLKTVCFKSKTWDSFEEVVAWTACDRLETILSVSPNEIHFSNSECRTFRGFNQARNLGCAGPTYDYNAWYYGAAISPKLILKKKKATINLIPRNLNSHLNCRNLVKSLELLSTDEALFLAKCVQNTNEKFPYTIETKIYF